MVHSVSKVTKKRKIHTKQLWQAVTTMKLREKKRITRGNSGRSSDINTVFFCVMAVAQYPLCRYRGDMASRSYVYRYTLMRPRIRKRGHSERRGKEMRRQTRCSGTAWHFGVWVSAAVRPCHFIGPDTSVKVRPSFAVVNDKRIITSLQRSSCRAPWAVELPSPILLLLFLLTQTQQDPPIPFYSNVHPGIWNGKSAKITSAAERFVSLLLYLVEGVPWWNV